MGNCCGSGSGSETTKKTTPGEKLLLVHVFPDAHIRDYLVEKMRQGRIRATSRSSCTGSSCASSR